MVIIIPLYSFQIESDKVGEGGAKIQRIEYLENEKSLCSSLFFKSFILVKQKEKWMSEAKMYFNKRRLFDSNLTG